MNLKARLEFWSPAIVAGLFLMVMFCIQCMRLSVEDESLAHWVAYTGATKGFYADPRLISHTPLYFQMLVWWQDLWGLADPAQMESSIALLRSFGLLTGLVTASFVGIGLGKLRSRVWWIAILMVHPLFVQSTLLVDIDNTLMTTCLVALAVAIDRRVSWIWIGLGIGFSLMVKEITPALVIPVWIFFSALRSRREFLFSVLGSILGLVFFFVLLRGWTWAYGLDWLEPLKLTLLKAQQKKSDFQIPWHAWGFGRWVFLSYLPLVWFGVAILALPVLGGFSRLPELKALPFSFWLFLACFLFYTWVGQAAYYFSKYTIPCWPLFVLWVAPHLEKEIGNVEFKHMGWAGIGILIGSLGLNLVLDPLAIIEHRRQLSPKVLILHGLAVLLPVVLFAFAYRYRNRRSMCAVPMLVVVSVFLAGWSIGHAYRSPSGNYLYGERGLKEVIARIRESSEKFRVLTPANDIAWILGKDAEWVSLPTTGPESVRDLAQRVLVSRNYNVDSFVLAERWASALERTHCRVDMPGEGGRFHIYYPKSHAACSQASKL